MLNVMSPAERGKTKARDVDSQKSRQCGKEQMKILLWQNLINKPFDKQGRAGTSGCST